MKKKTKRGGGARPGSGPKLKAYGRRITICLNLRPDVRQILKRQPNASAYVDALVLADNQIQP